MFGNKKLIHDLPENPGVANGLKRAMQMTDIRWSTICPMPSSHCFYTTEGKTYAQTFVQPGSPMTGMIYSSVLKNQKFLGYNVSLETFMTALTDPRSVLYEKTLHGSGRNNVGCWYGIVCSCFASYVHDLPVRTICRDWPKIPYVTTLGQIPAEEMKLLDVVLNTKRHIAVITDILRDEQGKVAYIQISEATLPQCKKTYFTPDEFQLFWYKNDFQIYRNTHIQEITYTPSPFVYIEADKERGIEADPFLPEYEYNTVLMPDQGNASNYSAEDPVNLDLLEEGWESVTLQLGGEEENGMILPVPEDKRVTLTGLKAGLYRAAALKADGTKSRTVEWAVTDVRLSADKEAYAPGETAVFTVNAAAGSAATMIHINRVTTSGEMTRRDLSAAEQTAGSFPEKVPTEPGEYFAFVNAKNRYGAYASSKCFFTVKES